MRGYLSDKIHKSDTPAYHDVMSSTEPEICMEGPARTGKSIIGIRKALAVHANNYGARTCIARAIAVDLDDTIRYDLRETVLRYQLDDPRSQIKQQGGLTKFTHLRLNGGEMRLGGMNRPSAILGGEYDFVFPNELSQWTEEQYMLMKTRCSGSAGNWKDKNGNVLFQMCSDTNPAEESDWMYESREKKGLLRFIPFTFTDNPYFYRNERWSRIGKTVVEEMDRGLVGIWHDRYFKGLRVTPAGIVYRLHPENLLDDFPDLKDCDLYRACDWGQTHPSICLWIAEHRETGDVSVYREWRKTHSDIDEIPLSMKAFSEGERIKTTIIDHEELRKKLLAKHGIPSQYAYKGAGSVMDRVFLIQAALRRAVEGKDGGLYIYKGLVCNSDPNPDLLRDSIIDEARNLYFSNTKDAPEKKGDDAWDALGYFFLYRNKRKPILHYTASVNRRTRA